MRGDRLRRMEIVEEAMTELLYRAEHWTTANASMHDIKCRRRELLDAARRYGRAMDALARTQ
jgi:hypothetical protein